MSGLSALQARAIGEQMKAGGTAGGRRSGPADVTLSTTTNTEDEQAIAPLQHERRQKSEKKQKFFFF